jgi:hypothetical protein
MQDQESMHLANGLQSIKVIHDFGFPGWPEPNLDWIPVIGGSDQYRGLAPAPFFILSRLSFAPSVN